MMSLLNNASLSLCESQLLDAVPVAFEIRKNAPALKNFESE